MTKFDDIREQMEIIYEFINGRLMYHEKSIEASDEINSLLIELSNREIADEFDLNEDEIDEVDME